MDDTGRLVSELHDKLRELDLKVWQYRRDMTAEFTKYKDDLLRDVPQEISDTVSRAIAEDMKGYSALVDPDATGAIDSRTAGLSLSPGTQRATTTPSSPTHSTSTLSYTGEGEEAEQEKPRDPHARELEFQGVFTPSYLPLLESTSREHSGSNSSGPPSPSPLLGKTKEEDKEDMRRVQVDESTATTGSSTPSPDMRRPSTPMRRSTDDVSVTSESSEGHIRRSALRSSSSSKPQSPRRVRFDVMGEEVLTTSSPPVSEGPPADDDDAYECYSLADAPDEKHDSEEVEDVEGPRRKKISSSEAIRALSRRPLEDDGTVWVTVVPGPDGSPPIDTADEASSENLQLHSGAATESRSSDVEETDGAPTDAGPGLEFTARDDEDADSDDGMLSMAPHQSRGQTSAPASTPSAAEVGKTEVGEDDKTNSAADTPSGNDTAVPESVDPDDENIPFPPYEEPDEDIFQFDDYTGAYEPKYLSEEPEERGDLDLDPPKEETEGEAEPAAFSGYSTSPPINIPGRGPPQPTNPSKNVVGSYRGKPFTMPIVNEELHAQAASLGAVNSLVGSLKDISGYDPSEVQSFRESLRMGGVGSLAGTAPKSFTERLMLEDLVEEERARQAEIAREENKAREKKAREDKAREDKAREVKAREEKAQEEKGAQEDEARRT